ncbi:MAG: hypothetical protein ACXVZV_05555 [Terriglobales bacterium]
MPAPQTTGLLGPASLDALLAGLIDYAGLFPPAALDMKTAVENYAKYLAGPHARALGRFVLPVSRFAEFEQEFAHIQPVEPWGLSALLSPKYQDDLAAIDKFNERNARTAHVDVIEVKASSPEEIAQIRAFVRGTITPYFEIRPFDCTELLQTIHHIRGRAKIRTGGLTPDAFPPSDILASCLMECAKYEVPFKATAGLHHPIRCQKPLTYAPDAPTGVMHGFLNVFIAATAAWANERTIQCNHDWQVRSGGTMREPFPTRFSCNAKYVEKLLKTVSRFEFRDDGIHEPIQLPRAVIQQARQNFAISFGSCSFEEPIADLKALNLL